MTADYCPNGHPTPTAAHRDTQGMCRECKKDYDRVAKARMRAAYKVCRGLEARGVRFENDGVPVPADEVAAQLLNQHGKATGPPPR